MPQDQPTSHFAAGHSSLALLQVNMNVTMVWRILARRKAMDVGVDGCFSSLVTEKRTHLILQLVNLPGVTSRTAGYAEAQQTPLEDL